MAAVAAQAVEVHRGGELFGFRIGFGGNGATARMPCGVARQPDGLKWSR
jgi:hypothetical protein